VPARRTPARPDTPCRELWNLSDTTAAWLAAAGVHTHAQLAAADLCQLWAKLRAAHPQVTKLMFLAMAGAVHDVHWRLVPSDLVAAFDAWRRSAGAAPTRARRSRSDQRASVGAPKRASR
jgi:hypothetical protein